MSTGINNDSNMIAGYNPYGSAYTSEEEEKELLKTGADGASFIDPKTGLPTTPGTKGGAIDGEKKKAAKGDKGKVSDDKGKGAQAAEEAKKSDIKGAEAKKDDIKGAEAKKGDVKSAETKGAEAKNVEKTEALKAELNTDSVSKTEANKQTQAANVLSPIRFEETTLSKEEAQKAYETGVLVTEVATELLEKCGGDLSKLSAEDLLAAFMKIQLADPAKNVETLNDLNDAMKSMRQLAHKSEMAQIKKQEVEQEKAIKAAKKASKYSSFAKVFKIVVIVVAVVVAIVATAATWGTAGPLMAIGLGALIAAIGVTAATVPTGIKEAELNKEATEQAAKATKAQIEAMDFERVKELFQEMVGDNQELLQAIMESFNQFCNVLKALVDRQGATAKVLSDATMR